MKTNYRGMTTRALRIGPWEPEAVRELMRRYMIHAQGWRRYLRRMGVR